MRFVTLLLAAGGLLANLLAAVLAIRQGWADPGGAAMGVLLGTAIFVSAGPLAWLVLVAFVLSSSLIGRLGGSARAQAHTLHEKGDRRDLAQAFANAGPGAIMALLLRATGEPAFAAGFAVAFAAATADTWAEEIGILSRAEPRSILTLRPVARGLSGGVSPLGFLAALAGAVLIAAVFLGVNAITPLAGRGHAALAGLVAAGGFVGSLVDSLLGATVQALYRVPSTGSLTERRLVDGETTVLVRGFPFVTNDVVNLLSASIVAVAAVFAWRLAAPA